MKSILLVCGRDNIDKPLRRSIAHLTNSCQVEVTPDGYSAYQSLTQKTFDLVIVDLNISGIDGMELVESINHIDPGIPVILMINNEHKIMWGTARTLNANPILRPFKPLTFLRLVDILLHQHLERYRVLSETMKSALQTLASLPEALSAFLVEENGLLLMTAGRITDKSLLEALGRLAAAQFTGAEPATEQLPPRSTNPELYLATIVENLHLALLVEANNESGDDLWLQIDTVVQDIRESLYVNTVLEADLPQTDAIEDAPHSIIHKQVPFSLTPPTPPSPNDTSPLPDDDPQPVNWNILSNPSDQADQANLLNRLQDILSG
jgi:CheY-like chemotaxis protein